MKRKMREKKHLWLSAPAVLKYNATFWQKKQNFGRRFFSLATAKKKKKIQETSPRNTTVKRVSYHCCTEGTILHRKEGTLRHTTVPKCKDHLSINIEWKFLLYLAT